MPVLMGLRPTKKNENPRERRAIMMVVAGRRGRRGSGEVETECLSDPERANVPMIVRQPSLPGAGDST